MKKEIQERVSDYIKIMRTNNFSELVYWATLYEDIEGIKHLVRLGINVNTFDNGYSLLANAILTNKPADVVQTLIDCGADINCIDDAGNTVLHYVRCSYPFKLENPIVSLLVKAGANITIKNKVSKTALHQAVLDKERSVVHTLLLYGADHTITDDLGNDPLRIAIGMGDKDTIKIFKSFGITHG